MKGDPQLAAIMRRLRPKAPVERVTVIDWPATAMSRHRLNEGQMVVILACGHDAVTRSQERAPCHRCHEMILNGEDYDAFRNRGGAESDGGTK